TGFLGSSLAIRLVSEGYDLTILKRSTSNLKLIGTIVDQIQMVDLDKTDLQTFLSETPRFDALIHTATCYGRKNEGELRVFETNTYFAFQLLEAAAEHKIPLFINSDSLLPRNFNSYSLSKKQFSEWGEHYAKRKLITFIDVQIEHMFGQGDSETTFTNYVIKECLNNAEKLDLTQGEQERDFIYIEDVVSAYLVLLKTGNSLPSDYSTFQLGLGKAIKVKNFVELVKKLSKSNTRLDFGAMPYRKNEFMFCEADTRPLQALGWKPKYTLESGILKTIEFEKDK
ncbi:MAG: NAD(P)-dependent oxidoreductase, partial [SAR324 cluster bacterium]|nr:NAD(P)-dependent oxidoreductase [SAR324 cluster bacterium]